MDLDPALVWSLGVNADMEFAAEPAPPVVPPTPPALAHISVAFDPTGTDPLNVKLILPDFNPATQKPPVKLIGVYAKGDVPADATPAWFVDPANAFPLVGPVDLAVSDPSHPTPITLAYTGPEIFDPRRYQVIEGFAP